MSTSHTLGNICNHHVFLLCNNTEQLKEVIVNCINKYLKRDHFCIYVSSDTSNTESNSSLFGVTSKILNYKKHLLAGNLLLLNYKHYYENAKDENLSPIIKLTEVLERAMIKRIAIGKATDVLIIGSIPGNLLYDKHFTACIEVEKFIQDNHSRFLKNGHNITVICPYSTTPNSIIKGNTLINIKDKLTTLHTKNIVLR